MGLSRFDCGFSTRRCFGLFSMVLGLFYWLGLHLILVWCKFISCCSARLVLLGEVDEPAGVVVV